MVSRDSDSCHLVHVSHTTLSSSLTGMTSYSHLLNLENLDISRNDVESLRRGFFSLHISDIALTFILSRVGVSAAPAGAKG